MANITCWMACSLRSFFLVEVAPQHLADTIAWLMRSILGHDSKILRDKDTQLLLTPKFWVLPLYREFLNRRIRPSPSSQRARSCTGLVKVICKETRSRKGSTMLVRLTRMIEVMNPVVWIMQLLYVWFPACWAPMVAERLFSWSPPSWVHLLAGWSARLRASPVFRNTSLAPK